MCSAVTKHSQTTLSIVLLFQLWRGWWQTRWQKHIFSSEIRRGSHPPCGSLVLGDYAKPLETSLTHKKVNKGCFDHATEVISISRSFFISIFLLCSLSFRACKHHLHRVDYHSVLAVMTATYRSVYMWIYLCEVTLNSNSFNLPPSAWDLPVKLKLANLHANK